MGVSKPHVLHEISPYPPVVSILGHVDHGKTSLLDAIRKTHITKIEEGGITQRVGASEVEIVHEEKTRRIVLIDTPGHEAFSQMRSQGVSASDIVLLVVAGDDGVMPQTKESIQKVKEAGIPFIVVITKVDIEGIHVDKVIKQLLGEEVMLEGYGGDIPFIEVSSKTGKNIKELLELILLVYDVSPIKKDETRDFYAVIIDSKLDKRRGVVASLVVKGGTLHIGEKLYIQQEEVGRVRALFSPRNTRVERLLPGDAVEVLGLSKVVSPGTLLYTKTQQVSSQVSKLEPFATQPQSLMQFLREKERDVLPVVLKTETSGELEAITQSLPQQVKVILEGQGDISVSDATCAKEFGAIVLGFNVGITQEAKRLCTSENVLYKTYRIIYELLDELGETVESFVQQGREVILGKASILASFSVPHGLVLGLRVVEGRIALGDTVRITRGSKVLGSAKLTSLRRGKQSIKEVGKGSECGVVLSHEVDFQKGDVLLSYNEGSRN